MKTSGLDARNARGSAKNRQSFTFFEPGELRDGELCLVLCRTTPPHLTHEFVPAYEFELRHANSGALVGQNRNLTHWIGHIGYGVEPVFRGQRYAARACRLLFPLARKHGMRELWITCNPDNLASARSIELAGGQYVETVFVPRGHELWWRGETQKCRYRVEL